MPELVPVDHDPFEGSAGPSFSPVEHDPFAAAPEKTFAGLPKGGGVESEGMSDAIVAGVRAAKAAASRFFQPSEVEKTGNIPVDLLKGGAEAAISRPFESVQAGVAAGAESLGPKVDPLLAKAGLRPMKELGRTAAGVMESEGVGGGRGQGAIAAHAPSAAPRETARVLQKIAQEASGETPGGVLTEGPPAAPTFPPATGPEPPQPAPSPRPAGQRSVGAAGGTNALEAASPEAQEMVQRSFEPSGYTRHSIEDVIEGLHPEETFGEANEDLRGHMGGLQSSVGQQRTEIANTLRDRDARYPERATGYINDAFGDSTNVREWEADIKRRRKAAADPLWEKFESTRITPTPEIEAIIPRLRAAGALTEANRFLAMEGKPATRGFPELTEETGGGNSMRTPTEQERIPTAEAFQYAKEALDDDISGSKKAGARRRLVELKNDLVNAIDNHSDPQVAGVWKSARDVWAGPTGVLKAKDFGRKVLTDAVNPEEFEALWGEMSPSNREGVRIGLRDMLDRQMGKKGTPGRRMANVESVINSPDNQLKIRAMLGDDGAEQLFQSFEQEKRMRQAIPRIIGNSETAPRESYKAFWAPPETGPLEKAAKVAGTVADVATLRVGSLAKKGLEYVGNRMDAGAARRSQRIAEEAGRIYSTVGPERDAIMRELTRRAEEGPGGLAGPVGRQPLVPQVLERGRSGRPIKRTPLPIGTENEILERGARKVEEGPAPGERPPPERQAMSFGDMKRRDFLKGIAATGIAAARPEVITSALKQTGMGERLVDAAAPRALARQAIYSFGEDKTQALNYLYEQAKNAKPGSPIEKAYRTAVRYITSGDITKEPSIWEKSVAELRAHDDTVRAGQAARQAAELSGRGEVSETAGPKLEASEAAKPSAEEEVKQEPGLRLPTQSGERVDADTSYPRASDTVDGLKVRKDVPNTASIGAELGNEGNYQELPGIREVPFSMFTGLAKPTPRTTALGDAIKNSGEINPLIVAVDEKGPYILEGSNRFDALQHIGKTSFPAVVVIDNSALERQALARDVTERGRSGRPTKTAPIPTGTENQILQAGFERSRGPTFYSGVEQAVNAAKTTKAPPQQWLATIKNAPGVGREEMQWLGLEDWLKDQKGPVTKQQLADYVRANQIEVREVHKAEGQPLEGGFILGEPKFASYQLPGGENYRELLLTLPDKSVDRISGIQQQQRALERDLREGRIESGPFNQQMAALDEQLDAAHRGPQSFKSSHFDEPNILAHVRFNDRTIDGKKTLFVEEVQSDWHKKGKKGGYTDDAAMKALKTERASLENRIRGEKLPSGQTVAERVDEIDNAIENAKGEVPDAPFKTTWPELAMKRMIRYAAENGYDKVAWTTGETQAARYDLSKHIDQIIYDPKEGTLIASNKGNRILDKDGVKPEELPDYIGKEAADKLLNNPTEKGTRGAHMLSGLDLKVGGEGMKGFYDQILPATVNKLVKKFGARVSQGDVHLAQPAKNMPDIKERAHTVDITPRLRESAFVKGLPQFASGGAVKSPMSTRKKYSYAHDRGTKAEHCSNCSMFRKPHGCTAVGGFIAKMGKCDIWEATRKRRADGGSLLDPTPMADNPPYSLSQDFHERLPEAEGLVEDRRNEPQSGYDHMLAHLQRMGQLGRLMYPWAPGRDFYTPESHHIKRQSGKLSEDIGVHDVGRPHRDAGGPINSVIPGFPSLAGGPGAGIAPMPEWQWNSQQPMAQPKSPTIESGFSFGGNHALTAESMEPSASSTQFKSGFSFVPRQTGREGK